MGRVRSIFTLLVITIMVLTSCSASVSYTKEFGYLPSLEGMKVEKFIEPKDGNMGVATYKVSGSKVSDIAKSYIEVLKKDDWKINSSKNDVIEAEKGEHRVTIAPSQDKSGILLTIVSK
ncbi:MAG: hypothetical protein RR838_10755 [Clostridium sp.]